MFLKSGQSNPKSPIRKLINKFLIFIENCLVLYYKIKYRKYILLGDSVYVLSCYNDNVSRHECILFGHDQHKDEKNFGNHHCISITYLNGDQGFVTYENLFKLSGYHKFRVGKIRLMAPYDYLHRSTMRVTKKTKLGAEYTRMYMLAQYYSPFQMQGDICDINTKITIDSETEIRFMLPSATRLQVCLFSELEINRSNLKMIVSGYFKKELKQ